MKCLLLLLLSFTAMAADVKMSQLPLGTGSTTGPLDSFPYTNVVAGASQRLALSDLINIPSLATPTFAGNVTAPGFVGSINIPASGTYVRNGSISGTFNENVPSTITNYTVTWPSSQGSAYQTLTNSDGAGTLSWSYAPTASNQILNCSLAASVGSNALTVALKDNAGSDPSANSPCFISFRNATSATGTYTSIVTSAAASVVVPASTTLGCLNAVNCTLYVYAVNNAGTVVLAVGNLAIADEGSVWSTTAISGGSTVGVLYSASAQSSKAVRLLGRIVIQEATAGTWASGATEVSNLPVGGSSYIESTASTPTNWAITSTQFGDLASISLQPGEWDLTGMVGTTNNGAVATSTLGLGISSTTGNSSTGLSLGINYFLLTNVGTTAYQYALYVPSYRINITSTTTYYLKGIYNGTITNLQTTGYRISARRVK